MSEKKIRYLANRRSKIAHKNLDREKLKRGSNKKEQHHLVSKSNSETSIPLCKSCHDFVSDEQNSLSVNHRKDKKIMAFKSISGILKLLANEIDFIVEKELQDGKNSS